MTAVDTAAPTAATLAPWQARAQSLGVGRIGAALHAVELAHGGQQPWEYARRMVARVAGVPVDRSAHAGLYYGAPALWFLLHAAATGDPDRYPTARQTLAGRVRSLVRDRLTAADTRVRAGQSAAFAEYDLFSGLSGYAALLLHQQPDCDELADSLRHLVRLTEPRHLDGLNAPGWWVDHHPDPTLPTPGGHANLGMAHGAAGLLAVLALAHRRGVRVNGQGEAISRLCDWFDRWRRDSDDGPRWPQWIIRQHLASRGPLTHVHEADRPSWCYGTPGIARALQLAALTTGDRSRQQIAETALAACLTPTALGRLTDPGICHGAAGLYQTAYRAAADALSPAIAARLPAVAARLVLHEPESTGFLTGWPGHALATHTLHTGHPRTKWDTCLLIT